jgi:hypothetical protein
VAKNPWDFLDGWANDKVHATVYDDKATAKVLASQCLEEARVAGFYDASIIKAAGGNLESFMLDRLNQAANAEVNRLVDKDRS